MEIFKKSWHWLFGKKEVEETKSSNYESSYIPSSSSSYASGGYSSSYDSGVSSSCSWDSGC